MKETNSWIDKKKGTKYRILVLGTPDGCLFPWKRVFFDAFYGPSGFADPSGSKNGEPIPIRGQNSATFSRLGSQKLAIWGSLTPNLAKSTGFWPPKEVKIRSPRGEICLGTTDFGLSEVKIRVLISDLGLPDPRSGVSDPRSGLPEVKFGLPEVKNDLWETQNRSPRPQKSIQFSSFLEWEKLPSFILDH